MLFRAAAGLFTALTLVAGAVPAAVADEQPTRLGTGYLLPVGAPPVPPALTAASWIVADLDTGAVLGAKDPHWRLAPASTLKTLSAITLIPRLDKNRWVTAKFDDVNVEGSKVGLVEHGRYTVKELLTALMIVSGNDAANVLSSAVGGQDRLAELMNEEAARLGAVDTHAVNPHGLDADGQVSTSYDLALIARAGMANEDFAWYSQVRRSSIAAPGGKRFEIYNHNKLITRGYDGAIGVKNGYTSKAKASFVGAARRDGRTLVAVVMRGKPAVWQEARSLLDWGFALPASTQPVGQLAEPAGGVEDAVAEAPAAPEAEEPATLARAGVDAPADETGGLLGAVVRTILWTVLLLGVAVVALRVRAVRRRRARLRYRRVPAPYDSR